MDRFYKLNRTNSVGRDSVIVVDNVNWGKLQIISLETLNSILQFNTVDMNNFIDQQTLILDPTTLKVRINEKLVGDCNITRVVFKQQDISPELPPDTEPIDTKLHLATDKNFLYVWVEDCSRWKRLPLSEF